MNSLYKIFIFLAVIVWVIDILNIDFIINNVHVAYFLDSTVPINFWFWLLFWIFIPSSKEIKIKKEM